MKKRLILYAIVFFSMIITPALAIRPSLNSQQLPISPPKILTPKKSGLHKDSFKVLDESTGKVITVQDKEFTYGAVITEMPPTFEPEALKSQAVASYTFFSKKRREQRNKPSKDLKGADFVVNTKDWKYYVPKEEMQKRWGDNFESHYKKLTQAVDPVLGELLESDGELIVAAYHAISGGKTEKSSDVFGGDIPYLTAVPSPGDLLAPNYCTTAEFSKDSFKDAVLKTWSNAKPQDKPEEWIDKIERTPSGMVKNITICGVTATGLDVRNAFGLRSADFDVRFKDDNFVFTVRGYGHGVGMSQYGAEYMARQGADYKQILAWYYPGTSIKK